MSTINKIYNFTLYIICYNNFYDGMLPGSFGNSQDFQDANPSIVQTFDILITIKQCADWNILPNKLHLTYFT